MKPRLASYVLMFSVAALFAIGMIAINSVGIAQPKFAGLFQKQAMWALVACVGFAVVVRIPYAWLRRYSFWMLAFALVLLVAVAIPGIGTVHGKARRWFELGRFNFQPSEFAKLALILALAYYAEFSHRQMRTFMRGIVSPLAIMLPVLALIAIEPDRGTALLLAGVCGVMLLVAGIRWTFVWPTGFLAAAAAVAYTLHDKFVLKRLDAWWHLEHYKDDASYQAYQAMLAFGQGGLFGLGLGNGLQKRGFVPENHTDFILSIVGEELGLVGALTVVVLFLLLIWSGFSIARHAPDEFGRLTAVGVTSLIGLQAAINIGVVTSAFPCKGLALPFVSYGGSSLVMMLASIALLYNIARHSQTEEAGDDGGFHDEEVSFSRGS